MQMVYDARVVVYLMTGFLESGKTSFLKQTIDKQYFKIDGTTVIILCEEGEEEYEEDLLARAKAKIVTVEDPEELTKEFLQEVEASPIVFRRKMYLYPIPDSEMKKSDGQLVQNPGW